MQQILVLDIIKRASNCFWENMIWLDGANWWSNLPKSVSPSWSWDSCRTRPLIPCAFRFPHCPAELNPVFRRLFEFWFWRGGRSCWAENWFTWTSDGNWFPVTILAAADPAPALWKFCLCPFVEDAWWGWWWWWWAFGAGKNEEKPSSPYQLQRINWKLGKHWTHFYVF